MSKKGVILLLLVSVLALPALAEPQRVESRGAPSPALQHQGDERGDNATFMKVERARSAGAAGTHPRARAA